MNFSMDTAIYSDQQEQAMRGTHRRIDSDSSGLSSACLDATCIPLISVNRFQDQQSDKHRKPGVTNPLSNLRCSSILFDQNGVQFQQHHNNPQTQNQSSKNTVSLRSSDSHKELHDCQKNNRYLHAVMHFCPCSNSARDSQKYHQDSIGKTTKQIATQQYLTSCSLQSNLENVTTTKHTLSMRRKGNQSLRHLSKRFKFSVEDERFCPNTKKASDLAQEPTEESEPGSTDAIDASERIQASQPVQQIPEMEELDNGSLLSPSRNNISFPVSPNRSKLLSDKFNTLKKKL